jgi:2-haloalkanoic acid dehalogenase type II
MSSISAVIFDMFETLAHNVPGQWEETFRHVCQRQRLDVDPSKLWQEWRGLDRHFRQARTNMDAPESSPPFKSYSQAWEESFREAFRRLGLRGDPAAAARMCTQSMSERELFPDVKLALAELRKRWRIALLSNADDAYLLAIVRRYGLAFEAAISSEQARAYKPHPAAFRKVLDALRVPAGQCMYVGDNLFDDVLGSKNVGMKAVWLNRNGAARDPSRPQPDYEIRSLSELPAVVETASR